MDEPFSYPPVVHLFFRRSQPDDAAWAALQGFAARWNATHESQFVDGGDELSVTLARGIRDPERPELEAALEPLKRLHGFEGIEAVQSRYNGATDYETADFIPIIAGGHDAGFVANEIDAYGPRLVCNVCGREGGDRERQLVASLRIDEDFLARSLAARGSSHADLMSLSNDGLLVSKRFADHLASYGATGFFLVEVLRVDTNKPSGNFFLLMATTAVVNPCPTHTPMAGEPCTGCGDGGGNRLGDLHIEEPLVSGLDVVSRHRHGMASLYLSRSLYKHLEAAKMIEIRATGALDVCRHEPAPERSRAVRPIAVPPQGPGRARPQCSVEAFMRYVRAPHPTVECTSRGDGPGRTFALENMIEPGANPAELDALEQRFPDVAHLRPLALQADGILLFFQAGHRPSRFPTRAAIQETEGEVDVSAAIRLEKSCDWPVRHAELAEQLELLGHAFRGAHGIPFARIVGSSDCLVCADGLFYYFAPSNYLYNNQVVARGLDELLGLLTTDLATFLGETASVTTYYDSDGQQHYPRKYRVKV